MNGRGEVDSAIGVARQSRATKAVAGALLHFADNETAIVPWGKREPPTYAAVAVRSGYSVRVVRRELSALQRDNWLRRHSSPRGTVAGQLRVGDDRDDEDARVCQAPRCKKNLTGKRADALYCSDRCRQAANRADKRLTARVERLAQP